jgi:hypothetical protein
MRVTRGNASQLGMRRRGVQQHSEHHHRTRVGGVVRVQATTNADDGENGGAVEQRVVRTSERAMSVMRGETTLCAEDADAAERITRTVRLSVVGSACVAAFALGGGWVMRPQPVVASNGRSSLARKIDDVKNNGVYVAQRVFEWPLYGKMLVIMTAMVPLVLGAAAMYKHVSEEEWGESIAKTFYWMNDVPGADSTGEESLKTIVVAQLIVFIGMFTFAILIGVVSDEIASKVDEVKNGNSKVYEKDHTVIVNWNKQLIPLLKQIAVAKSEGIGFQKPVVLLADRDKEEMDNIIADELSDSPEITIVTRQGQGYDAEDLDRVNAWNAERVVVLHEDGDDMGTIESNKAATVLNVRSDVNTNGKQPDIIVQVPHRLSDRESHVSLAVDLTNRSDKNAGKVAFVNGTSELSKLKAFSVMQPGGCRLFEDLMLQSDDSCEFYTFSHPSLAGKTFREAWRMFNSATLVGLTSESGDFVLGPGDDQLISSRGEVVVIAENKSVIEKEFRKRKDGVEDAFIPQSGSQSVIMKRCPIKMPAARNIFMLGWNSDSADCLQDMLTLAPPGSKITVVSNADIPSRELKGNQCCAVKHIKADAMERATLEKLKIQEAGSVLIMPPDGPNDPTSSYALASVMQIAHLAKNANTGHAPHIVAELDEEVTKRVAEDIYANIGTLDIILHDNLIGGALLQVSANPKLAGLFDFLLEKDGKELYIRPYDEFSVEEDGELTWGVLCERARERDEIAVGVLLSNGMLKISPRKDTALRLWKGDKIVVLAEDWWTNKSAKVKQR